MANPHQTAPREDPDSGTELAARAGVGVEPLVRRYQLILADPPWSYKNSGCRGAAENEYSTMRDDNIFDLPVDRIAHENAVLILWATWPKMTEAFQLIDAWGFSYVTGFPWIKITNVSQSLFGGLEIKVPYGIGFWARGASEPILICKRGKVSPPKSGHIGLLSPNLFHSRKPDSIYEYAEALPGPRLEMFARRRRKGWDVFGNEVDGSIDLST